MQDFVIRVLFLAGILGLVSAGDYEGWRWFVWVSISGVMTGPFMDRAMKKEKL